MLKKIHSRQERKCEIIKKVRALGLGILRAYISFSY
jgi:hypothetical protein